MELGALLELNLHTHTAEVEEITDQALKEEKMEQALKRLDEVWANVSFVSSNYKEGSDVQLLAIAEEDFDMWVPALHRCGVGRGAMWCWCFVLLGRALYPRVHCFGRFMCALLPPPGWRTTS
jgi:hypothetical protein